MIDVGVGHGHTHRTSIDSLLIGTVKPLAGTATQSGIDKQPVTETIRLSRSGLEGDGQGDTRHHGGPDKALHHYPFKHYHAWRREIGDLPLLDGPGAFGENISTEDLDETNVAVGDVFRAGTALIEVSQGRQPCWKLNIRFGVADMAKRVQRSGRSGWYYRVLEPGLVAAGDTLTIVERRSPDWPLARLWRTLYVDVLDYDALAAMAALPHLPANWRRYAERRLETRTVEDWTKRLTGSDAG